MDVAEYTSQARNRRVKNRFLLLVGVLQFVSFTPAITAYDGQSSNLLFGTASLRYLNPRSTLGGFPGVESCCDTLNSGLGFGASLLVGKTLYQPSQELAIDLLVGGNYSSTTLRRIDFIGFGIVRVNNRDSVDSSLVEHAMRLQTYSAEARANFRYLPTAHPNWQFLVGLNTVFTLAASGEQTETLLRPANAVYEETRSKTRLSFSGDVTPLVRTWIAAGIGVAYEFAVSSSDRLNFGLNIEVPFTNTLRSSERGLTLGLLRADATYTFGTTNSSTAAVVPGVPTDPNVPLVSPWLSGTLTVNELLDDDQVRELGIVTIEETLSRQLYPILPYVFFDQDLSNLNSNTYANLSPEEAKSFDERYSLTFDRARSARRSAITLEVYYNILNILGRRMRDEYPTSSVELHGYNNDRGRERADTNLSYRRAESIKDYLVRVWGIAADRIHCSGGNLSPNAALTNMRDERDREDGFEENRRVEIIPSNEGLIAPVIIDDTLREITTPTIRYRVDYSASGNITGWSLEARHPFLPNQSENGSLLRRQGAGEPPTHVDWRSGDSQKEIPKSADPITATLTISSNENLSTSSTSTLPIKYISISRKKQERIGHYSVDRYRLPLFLYGSDQLQVAQKQIIDLYINNDLDSNAEVDIEAYTDRKGTDTQNDALSRQRANQVRQLISRGVRGKTLGYGEGTKEVSAPFPNETPEGRLYNRTVEVTVYRSLR